MIRAVLFDIGGVLEITPDTGWAGRWERELGLADGDVWRRLEVEWRDGRLGAMTEEEVVSGMALKLGLSDEQVPRFLGDFWNDYLGTANRELIDWFAAQRPERRTGIVSNSFVGARERERERYGFEELTDTIVYSHEVGIAKPDPAIYRMACERLGVPPEQTVFLDDVPQAVEGARAAGMAAVLYSDTAQAIADLEAVLAG